MRKARGELIMSRSRFVRMLAAKLDDKSAISRLTSFVEHAMRLSNGAGQDVYVIEVSDGISLDDVTYLRQCFAQLGVLACLVPQGTVDYVATLTPESFGVSRDGNGEAR